MWKKKEEAQKRHDFMISFLKEFFLELNQESWIQFLDRYLKDL